MTNLVNARSSAPASQRTIAPACSDIGLVVPEDLTPMTETTDD
jgi:hypothetical protein